MALLRRVGVRILEYWKNIGNDYLMVAKDTVTDMQKRKLRSAIVCSSLAGLTYAYKTNPTEDHYWDSLALARHKLVLIPESIRSPSASGEVRTRTEYRNQKRLSYLNFVFFSLITAQPNGEKCALYETQCKSLKPSLLDFPSRVVDIGAFNRWHLLDRALVDFDVNDREWMEQHQQL